MSAAVVSAVPRRELPPILQADGSARVAGFSPVRNAVEDSAELRQRDPALDAALDAAIAAVYTTFSQRYLRTLQQFLRPYATHRHSITIYADIGVCGIHVNGRDVQDKPSRGLYGLLSHSLSWQWCSELDGVRLN